MADIAGAFFRGQQAGQAKLAHEQALEDNKIRMMVLKHQMDSIKIDDQIRARKLAQENAALLQGQPAAELPQEAVTQPNLPSQSYAGAMTGLPGGEAPTTLPAPAAQAVQPQTNDLARRVAPVNIPGVEALGVPGVSIRPQSMEDLLLAQRRNELQKLMFSKFAPGEVVPALGAEPPAGPRVTAQPRPPATGSFEDFIIRKYGPNPTPDQLLEGRKLFGQADDRAPRITVSTGGGNEDAKAIAQAIANGDQPPTLTGLYRNAGPVRAELARMKYDLTKATTDWNATQKHVATLNGQQQTRMAQAIDNASHSLDVIDDLANQWDGGKLPALNKAQLLAAKQGLLGAKAQQIATKLDAQIADVTSELANVYMGGNSPTDHALDLAAKNLQANWSRDQLRSLIRQSKNNLQIRSNSMRNVGVAGASQGNIYAPQQAPVVNPTLRYNPATGKLEPIK